MLQSSSTSSIPSSSDDLSPTPNVQTNSQTPTIPIMVLNRYCKYWDIQGRVLAKTSLRTYNNVHGSGKVFGFDLVDHDEDEIHISPLVKLLSPSMTFSKFENFTLFPMEPNRNYNDLNTQWEIFMFFASIIEHFIEDVTTIPSHLFHFK